MSGNSIAVTIADTTIAENTVSSIFTGQGGGYAYASVSLKMIRCSIYANTLKVRDQGGGPTWLTGLGGGLFVGGGGHVALQWCNVTANLVNVSGLSITVETAAGGGGHSSSGLSQGEPDVHVGAR